MPAADPTLAIVNLALAGALLIVVLVARSGSRARVALAARRSRLPPVGLLKGEFIAAALGVVAGGIAVAVLLPRATGTPQPLPDFSARFDRLDKSAAGLSASLSTGFATAHQQVIDVDAGLTKILARLEGKIDKIAPQPAPPVAKARLSLYWTSVGLNERRQQIVRLALQNLGNRPARIRSADIEFCRVQDNKLDTHNCIAEPIKNPACTRTLVCEKDMMMLYAGGGASTRYATIPPQYQSVASRQQTPFGIVLSVQCQDATGQPCEISDLSAICGVPADHKGAPVCAVQPVEPSAAAATAGAPEIPPEKRVALQPAGKPGSAAIGAVPLSKMGVRQ